MKDKEALEKMKAYFASEEAKAVLDRAINAIEEQEDKQFFGLKPSETLCEDCIKACKSPAYCTGYDDGSKHYNEV